MTRPTYYDILGVDATASPEQISRVYKRAIHRFEADCSVETTSVFALMVHEAYEVLGDDEKRRRYDRSTLPQPVVPNEGAGEAGQPPATRHGMTLPAATVSSAGAVRAIQGGDASDRSTSVDHLTVVGWWSYSAAIAILAGALVTAAADRFVVPGAHPTVLLSLGAAGALVTLAGALRVGFALRVLVACGVVAVLAGTGVFAALTLERDEIRFLVPVLYLWLLVGGSLLIARQRRRK